MVEIGDITLLDAVNKEFIYLLAFYHHWLCYTSTEAFLMESLFVQDKERFRCNGLLFNIAYVIYALKFDA